MVYEVVQLQTFGEKKVDEQFTDDAYENVALWTEVSVGSGSRTFLDGTIHLTVTTGATDSFKTNFNQAVVGTAGGTLRFVTTVNIGTNFYANNVREWGLLDSTENNGIIIRLDGTVLKVITRIGGADTETSIDVFKPTDGKYHWYEVRIKGNQIDLYFDNRVIYQNISPPYDLIIGNDDYRPFFANRNTATPAGVPDDLVLDFIGVYDTSSGDSVAIRNRTTGDHWNIDADGDGRVKSRLMDGDSSVLLDVELDSAKNAAFVQSETLAQDSTLTDRSQKTQITDGTNDVTTTPDGTKDRLDVNALVATVTGKFISVHLRSGGSADMDVNGSVTPVEFIAGPGTGKKWFVARIIIIMEDVGMNWSKFGGLATLTNGVELEYDSFGVVLDLLDGETLNKNKDFIEYCYDATIEASSTDILKARWSFSASGTFLVMGNTDGDLFTVRVNDNLTGLSYFHIVLQGYEVDE